MKSSLLKFCIHTFVISILVLQILSACSKKTTKESSSDNSSTKTDTECATLTTPAITLDLTDQEIAFFNEAQKLVEDLSPEGVDAKLDTSSYLNRGGAQHVDFHFSVSGIPLCQFETRVHSLKDKTYVEGNLPDSVPVGEIPPPMEESSTDLKRILTRLNLEGTMKNRVNTPCLAWDGKKLVSALEINFQVGDLPYYALVTEKDVLKAEARFFDAVVEEDAQIYVKDPNTSTNLTLKTFTLSGMSGGGSLCSARLKTVVPSSVTQAFASKSGFIYPTTDQRFLETSFFTNASNHVDWFLGLGILSAWPGPKIDLMMDGTKDFANNSSVYIPGSTGSSPTIKVGSGDGVSLQNLYIDYDVIAHELGHHVVYQKLTTTSGQSLVIHEGLADFFVYGKTQYPCLGNLICPKNGTLCYSSTCLRTGEFPLGFDDANLPTEPHKLSQVISSLLWDIGHGNTDRSITGIGVELITKILLKAIDFFPKDAGYADLMSSLMKADKALNSSANCATIQAAAYSRGLQGEMAKANVSCETVP